MEWVRDRMMPALGLGKVTITEANEHTGTYPDLWSAPATMTITITPEWARQPLHERRKRLLHEGIHLAWGWGHGARERKLGYYSRPDRDAFTRELYRRLFQ